MISSKDNPKIKYLKSLKQKKYRDQHGQFLVFGEHLIKEAKNSNLIVELFTSNPNKGGTLISKTLMKDLNETVTPFDQFALVNFIDNNISSNKVLVLEDVQDPSNVGALLRSALAFGFHKVILSERCADIYNDKTIRASQGSLFKLDIIRTNVYEKVVNLHKQGFNIVATTLNGKDALPNNDKIVIVLGNEGSGISDNMLKLASHFVTIKTLEVESLNVLVAGSILMYEGSKI